MAKSLTRACFSYSWWNDLGSHSHVAIILMTMSYSKCYIVCEIGSGKFELPTLRCSELNCSCVEIDGTSIEEGGPGSGIMPLCPGPVGQDWR